MREGEERQAALVFKEVDGKMEGELVLDGRDKECDVNMLMAGVALSLNKEGVRERLIEKTRKMLMEGV